MENKIVLWPQILYGSQANRHDKSSTPQCWMSYPFPEFANMSKKSWPQDKI
jgi:hypothetical protein